MSEDELKQRRLTLEEEKLRLEEEELQVKRLKLQREREQLQLEPSPSILRLNVGGQTFDTTKDTLLASGSSFFARLLGAQRDDEVAVIPGAMRDAEGRLFIDRSPDGFRLVLEWLRGSMDVDALDKVSRDIILKEALYYDLPRLARELHGGYDPSLLPEVDQQIREQAAAIRQALADGRQGAAEEADAALIPVFTQEGGGRKCQLTCTSVDEPALPGIPLLFGAEAVAKRFRRMGDCTDNSDFRARLNLFAGPLFENLDLTNLVVAGGAVLQTLQLRNPAGAPPDTVRDKARRGLSDIDLFVVADDEAIARAAFDRVFNHLKSRLDRMQDEAHHHGLLVLRSEMAVTFFAGYPQRTIQLILRRYSCVADVIFNFDVDACQLAYDGQRVVATPSAVRAFKTGINIADPERSSPAYEKRLAKYSSRGFSVAVPGLELERVSPRFVSGCFTTVEHSFRRLTLTFAGGDQPAYQVGKRSVVGLPKLIVFANLRTSKQRRADNSQWNRRTLVREWESEHSGDSESGTYLISYSKLTKYGHRDPREVWRKPTPPAPPPANVLEGDQTTRAELLDLDYEGVLLPYALIRNPSQLVGDLERQMAAEDGSPTFCFELIEHNGAGAGPGIPQIEDAAQQHADAYDSGTPKLPRHIQFPPSNSTGLSNPFSRLPAEEWFGDVYALDETSGL